MAYVTYRRGDMCDVYLASVAILNMSKKEDTKLTTVTLKSGPIVNILSRADSA